MAKEPAAAYVSLPTTANTPSTTICRAYRPSTITAQHPDTPQHPDTCCIRYSLLSNLLLACCLVRPPTRVGREVVEHHPVRRIDELRIGRQGALGPRRQRGRGSSRRLVLKRITTYKNNCTYKTKPSRDKQRRVASWIMPAQAMVTYSNTTANWERQKLLPNE